MNNWDRPLIELVSAEKEFAGHMVLKQINFSIAKGEFVTLLGPSGSGKTTILRILAGFEWLTRGEIKLRGRDIKDLEPYKRPISTIFQDYALFPHLSVVDNIKFGLRQVRIPCENVRHRALNRLPILQASWERRAYKHLIRLKRRREILQNRLDARVTSRTTGIQNRIDDLDFIISYWENYVELKSAAYQRRYLMRRLSHTEMHDKIHAMMEVVGLGSIHNKRIDQLSGGMKQRVALARSLVIEPEILLLDEPLSALDGKLRESMRTFLRNIQRQLDITFIFVTHDRDEALELSDRIAIIRDGRIEQFDTPRKVYDYPRNRWVANFIGDSNIYVATIVSPGVIDLLGVLVEYDHHDPEYANYQPGMVIDCCLRPEDIDITRDQGKYYGRISSVVYKGSYYCVTLEYGEHTFSVETSDLYHVDQRVGINFARDAVHIMLREDT